ncbi:hypothetical protein [Pseudolactococcus insecticola]|uniref:Uncharacterized protein n=1 Tax=Pseudolactococcus insecticola TaxID=2709158 RepID=A0A6A0B9G0_9LACT|nr:hypothetical protein [Lactococcus insecticola]GFH41253.1 hypothetical protein Hs20B_16510 [Lactococcus insecticola]
MADSKFIPQEQNPQNFPFDSPQELAHLATSAGLSVKAYMQLYFDNLYEAQTNYWYTAKRFRAKIEYVSGERNNAGLTTFTIHYYYGNDYEKKSEVRIIGVQEDNNIHGTLDIGKRAKELSQRTLGTSLQETPEVYLVQAYAKNRYQNIIDVMTVEEAPKGK